MGVVVCASRGSAATPLRLTSGSATLVHGGNASALPACWQFPTLGAVGTPWGGEGLGVHPDTKSSFNDETKSKKQKGVMDNGPKLFLFSVYSLGLTYTRKVTTGVAYNPGFLRNVPYVCNSYRARGE